MIVNEDVRLLIPCYNVENYLDVLLTVALKHIPANRVLVVDDGSSDQTSEIARRYGVELIVHTKNLGKGSTLRDGFDYLIKSGADWVITIDGDMQHDPALLTDFIEYAIDGNYDLVIGSRRYDLGGMPWDRRLSNYITSLFLSIVLRKRLRDSQCGFRLIRCRLLEGLEFISTGYEFETECLLKLSQAGAKIGSIDIPTRYSGASSSIKRFRDSLKFLGVVLRFILKRKSA